LFLYPSKENLVTRNNGSKFSHLHGGVNFSFMGLIDYSKVKMLHNKSMFVYSEESYQIPK